jgi:hypothetical protein
MVYKIGDIGPAGGWIFYDKGSYTGGWRYLEAAPRDAGEALWGPGGEDINGTGTAVGSGKRNTQLLLEVLRQAGAAGMAAHLCTAFEAGGFKDWFLPSKDELDLMYKNLKSKGLGNFQIKTYLSSSEYGAGHAWCQYFDDGRQFLSYSNRDYVRAVRAF